MKCSLEPFERISSWGSHENHSHCAELKKMLETKRQCDNDEDRGGGGGDGRDNNNINKY